MVGSLLVVGRHFFKYLTRLLAKRNEKEEHRGNRLRPTSNDDLLFAVWVARGPPVAVPPRECSRHFCSDDRFGVGQCYCRHSWNF